MAIVREKLSGSAVVKIDDSCCRGITAEEAARRWAEVGRAILTIDRNRQLESLKNKALSDRGGKQDG